MRDQDFDRIYRREAQGLYGFLAYRTGDSALAEDLLADTFERALRARRGFDRRRGTERNWLYAIALNLLRDHGRRKVLLVNRTNTPASVDIDGMRGARLRIVDQQSAGGPIRDERVTGGTITLGGYAVAVATLGAE